MHFVASTSCLNKIYKPKNLYFFIVSLPFSVRGEMSNFDEVELSEYVEGSSPKQIETGNENDEQTETSGKCSFQRLKSIICSQIIY